ncbi:hypothetical protein HD554DRAFT_2178381 [Boletus coccyginus]|nr:hypothetical protein HD554DRAFT_2178381 [Boletus coccyginus]
MCDEPISRLPSTTDDALKLFSRVTKSIVVLAKPDVGDTEQVVIKIYDLRYLDERIAEVPSRPSYPWGFANEQAAAMARAQNSKLSDEELVDRIYSDSPEDLSSEDLLIHHLFWEERFRRLLMESYHSELSAYERLKDLQGSAIPCLIMAGEFLPPDERAIQPSALVLEYIPSVSLHDVPLTAITPAIRKQLISAIESFPSHGVIHNDITLSNIHFTPPEHPERAFVIDFGCAMIRRKDHDEEYWTVLGASDVRWARRLLNSEIRKLADLRASSKFR